ncbi:MAG: flagellar motor switch protein FliN [Candidatus Lambdaproteobacteria bacterium]|nr:flagellar motor switch protein FliN [Candidatus Lambdaproteobacteria bacterium]
MAQRDDDTALTEADDFGAEEGDDELYSVIGHRKSLSPIAAAKGHDDDTDSPYHKIEFIHDVPLRLSVEIGQTQLSVREILGLSVGGIVEFTKVVGEPMDITVSGRLMARGEVVVVNERYGVRISEVTRPDESEAVSSADN